MTGLTVKPTVVAVGRFGARDPEKALFDTYAARLRPRLDLVEVEERRLEGAARQAREGELLLAAVPSGAAVIVMDGRGEVLSSEELAARLERLSARGFSKAAFLIGGADGHREGILRRADLCYSFGPATWPHMMVRAMLAEQIYRADTILAGHPYHRARGA